MRETFREIYESVARGLPARWELEIEGETYTRTFTPRERVILLGAGHISQPLCALLAGLGFSVTVVDERESYCNRERFPEAAELICEDFVPAIGQLGIGEGDYVVTITRGHSFDGACLRAILPGTMPRYLGMIASKRRAIGLLDELEKEGIPRERLDAIHTPIGLPINAITPAEIAVSIAAEIIQERRKFVKRHSHDVRLVNEDASLETLRFLAEDPAPKTVLLVYETSGSTPVKSGALMALDENFKSVGTIGGGCGEWAIMRDAYAAIGTGTQKCVTVDLSNEIAAEEGMVCGGEMKVLIADVTA